MHAPNSKGLVSDCIKKRLERRRTNRVGSVGQKSDTASAFRHSHCLLLPTIPEPTEEATGRTVDTPAHGGDL